MDEAASRAEAKRSLVIAEKLLTARDLVGSKKFAERAMDSDPLLDGVDQVLAVADVLLAAMRRINNHIDWYAILQLDLSSDPSAVKRQYRRLALLLHPEKNRFPGAHEAFKLVVDAWSLLSDPSKKSLLDKELTMAAAAAHVKSNGSGGGGGGSRKKEPLRPEEEAVFWTFCLHCCHVYQYGREFKNRSLRCQNCKKAFHAAEMLSAPPVVPGTDMYFCSWGLFPLGFPGGPVFNESPIAEVGPNRADGNGLGSGKRQSSGEFERKKMANMAPVSGNNTSKRKKKMAMKPPKEKTGSGLKQGIAAGSRVDINVEPKNDSIIENGEGEGSEMKQPEVIDINDGVGVSQNVGVMGGETFDMNRFIIDLDATDEVLGNLSNLPFLKDEEQYIQPSLFDG